MIVRSCDSSTIVAQVRGHACKDVEFHDERWPYDRANKAAIHAKVDDNIVERMVSNTNELHLHI